MEFNCRRCDNLQVGTELVAPLQDAGYNVEPCVVDPGATVIVSVPVDAGEGIRTAKELSMWEQQAHSRLYKLSHLRQYYMTNFMHFLEKKNIFH